MMNIYLQVTLKCIKNSDGLKGGWRDGWLGDRANVVRHRWEAVGGRYSGVCVQFLQHSLCLIFFIIKCWGNSWLHGGPTSSSRAEVEEKGKAPLHSSPPPHSSPHEQVLHILV